MVLVSLNRCGMVGVGLGGSLKGENQIWSEKRILLYFQIIMSYLTFLAHEVRRHGALWAVTRRNVNAPS